MRACFCFVHATVYHDLSIYLSIYFSPVNLKKYLLFAFHENIPHKSQATELG